jgi:hypothetical protein
MNILQSLKNLAFIFSRRDKQKLFLVSMIQILLSILDLIAVGGHYLQNPKFWQWMKQLAHYMEKLSQI